MKINFTTPTYDGLNRRISTTSVLVTNGVALSTAPTTINSYYDPQVEFLELGVNYGSTTEWKLYGPDLHGVYGGMNGVGGLDAVSPILNLFQPTVSDFRGNILGVITNGMMFWNPARPTGYGAVPGYQPLPLANGANIALASAWRGRWADITGLYNIGLRPYEATSGRWLTFDSVWNEIDPNGMSFSGGDPINSMDSDGRLSAQSALNTLGQDNSTKNLYFGIAPVMQTYIQTIYGINGLSVPTGMPGEPDSVLTNPGDITGQSQRLWTIPTGQYFSYVSQTPLPDNWGQTTASWINSSGPDLMDIQLKEAGSYFKLLGAGAAVASGAEELLPELLGAEASVAAETTAADTAPFAGQKLYRVYGGDSAAGGASWSPVNPGSVANYRDVAGLPSGGASGFNNSGRFVIEGTLQDPAGVVNVRSALPLDGNSGGILEYIIPNWQKTGAIQVNRVSGVNPEF